METYRNLSGNLGVQTYEIGPAYITVKFSGTARTYTYSYRKAGSGHVEQMKVLARQGRGLGGYINRHVKYLYD